MSKPDGLHCDDCGGRDECDEHCESYTSIIRAKRNLERMKMSITISKPSKSELNGTTIAVVAVASFIATLTIGTIVVWGLFNCVLPQVTTSLKPLGIGYSALTFLLIRTLTRLCAS